MPSTGAGAMRCPILLALITFADAPGVRLITNIVDAAVSSLAHWPAGRARVSRSR